MILIKKKLIRGTFVYLWHGVNPKHSILLEIFKPQWFLIEKNDRVLYFQNAFYMIHVSNKSLNFTFKYSHC